MITKQDLIGKLERAWKEDDDSWVEYCILFDIGDLENSWLPIALLGCRIVTYERRRWAIKTLLALQRQEQEWESVVLLYLVILFVSDIFQHDLDF